MSNYILFHSLWCNMIIVLFVKTEADEDNTMETMEKEPANNNTMKTEQRKNNTMRTEQRKNNTMESLETEEVS